MRQRIWRLWAALGPAVFVYGCLCGQACHDYLFKFLAPGPHGPRVF
jgi:hypothetical protein